MKLFILFTDLASHHEEWKKILNTLSENNHDVCVVTPHLDQTQQFLQQCNLKYIHCFSRDESMSLNEEILKAHDLMNGQQSVLPLIESSIIVAISDPSKLHECSITMPIDVIEMDLQAPHVKLFTTLEEFCYKKRSELAEFNDLNLLLEKINHELDPLSSSLFKGNLKAQKNFLTLLLSQIDQYPNMCRAECILVLKAEYMSEEILHTVLDAPADRYFLGWKLSSEKTPLAKIIEKAESQVSKLLAAQIAASVESRANNKVLNTLDAEEYEEKLMERAVDAVKYVEASHGNEEETRPLLSRSPVKSYGTF